MINRVVLIDLDPLATRKWLDNLSVEAKTMLEDLDPLATQK